MAKRIRRRRDRPRPSERPAAALLSPADSRQKGLKQPPSRCTGVSPADDRSDIAPLESRTLVQERQVKAVMLHLRIGNLRRQRRHDGAVVSRQELPEGDPKRSADARQISQRTCQIATGLDLRNQIS